MPMSIGKGGFPMKPILCVSLAPCGLGCGVFDFPSNLMDRPEFVSEIFQHTRIGVDERGVGAEPPLRF